MTDDISTWKVGDVVEYKNDKGEDRELLRVRITDLKKIESNTFEGETIEVENYPAFHVGELYKQWNATVFTLYDHGPDADSILKQLDQLEDKYRGI